MLLNPQVASVRFVSQEPPSNPWLHNEFDNILAKALSHLSCSHWEGPVHIQEMMAGWGKVIEEESLKLGPHVLPSRG